ncbi:MAG: BamA/TamA family outer membrane protein [Deltaproteobacteria bacterium]|nr:BamA/TamA family outer membrane protein [Deltaproteobacteria bacterium]
MPEDLAQKILSGETVREDGQERPLDASDVPVRGGNLFVCPRIELRAPLTDTFGLGLFLDTGNVWSSEDSIGTPMDLLRLRYAAGAGLRLATPIGPLAFDYGFNLIRRPWEDLGALHFSVGVF